MSFKVPFLADAQIEDAAQELLRRYAQWRGEPPRLSHCPTYSWTSLRSADSCTRAGAVSVYLERQWSDAVGIVARRDTDGPLLRAPSTSLAPSPKFHSRPVSTTEWSFLGPVRNGDHSVVTF